MLVNATATIALDGWPPPTIEIHALLAALGDCGHRPDVGPAQAFQHLNEVDISFAFEVADGVRADSRAQQIVLESMSRVYGGPIHVHVAVVAGEPTAALAIEPQPGARTVVDLTAPDIAAGPAHLEPAGSAELPCATSGCDRSAALYAVRMATVSATDGELELTLPLCSRHAQALGKQAVSRTPV